MSGDGSAHVTLLGFAVAFGVFTLLFAFAPSWGGEPLSGGVGAPDAPLVRVVASRDVCYVGQEVAVTYEYYNPWAGNVTFTPPGQVAFHVKYPGEDAVSTTVHISWAVTSVTLEPGDSFAVYTERVTAVRPGNVTVVINGMGKTIRVLR